jgi:molecular chaperone HscB
VNLNQNYFELFDLPINPEVDFELLSMRYRELQQQTHPDRFASASEHEQRMSLQHTTLVNEAYEVLCSNLKRAVYLLELRGTELTEKENTAVEPDFLMEQIELREALEEINESSEPLVELDQLRSEVDTVITELDGEFGRYWQENTEDSLNHAITTVRKMQYMTKLKHEIDLKEEELLDY